MARVTFQKRQKEMKRQEKQRMKAERRAQKKLEKGTGTEGGAVDSDLMVLNDFDLEIENGVLITRFPGESDSSQ